MADARMAAAPAGMKGASKACATPLPPCPQTHWRSVPQVPKSHRASSKGGVVAALHHSQAPGTLNPPRFLLGDFSIQSNLSKEGRARALSVGTWFQQRQLQPGKVMPSPWRRCVDSAPFAFGPPKAWSALASPHGSPEATGAGICGSSALHALLHR